MKRYLAEFHGLVHIWHEQLTPPPLPVVVSDEAVPGRVSRSGTHLARAAQDHRGQLRSERRPLLPLHALAAHRQHGGAAHQVRHVQLVPVSFFRLPLCSIPDLS